MASTKVPPDLAIAKGMRGPKVPQHGKKRSIRKGRG